MPLLIHTIAATTRYRLPLSYLLFFALCLLSNPFLANAKGSAPPFRLGSDCKQDNDFLPDTCPDSNCGSRAQCSSQGGSCFCRCLPGAVLANRVCDTNCWDCTGGTYAGGADMKCIGLSEKSECLPCPVGTYSNQERNERCLSCPAGTVTNTGLSTGATACKPCFAGSYSPPGSGECIICPPGTFSEAGAANKCTPCPAGSYSTVSGANSNRFCSLCPRGTFSAPGSTECTYCPVGTFADREGSPQCTKCPINKYNTNVGSESCRLCPVGQYSSPALGGSICHTCPSSLEVAAPFTSFLGGRCCRRDASLLNSGTDGTDTITTGPSLVLKAGDYPSVLGSLHHFYLNLSPDLPPLIYKNGDAVITSSQKINRAYIVSPSFRYFVYFQPNGNICKYEGTGPSCILSVVRCSNQTLVPLRFGGKWEHIQTSDGNLCTFNHDDGVMIKAWCLDGPREPGDYMEMLDDGRFCRKSAQGYERHCW